MCPARGQGHAQRVQLGQPGSSGRHRRIAGSPGPERWVEWRCWRSARQGPAEGTESGERPAVRLAPNQPEKGDQMVHPSVDLVALNPQPLPPNADIKLVSLNPQPLPPDATIELVALNPQPLPPDATINLVALNPQPLPPGAHQAGRAQPAAARRPETTVIDFVALEPAAAAAERGDAGLRGGIGLAGRLRGGDDCDRAGRPPCWLWRSRLLARRVGVQSLGFA